MPLTFLQEEEGTVKRQTARGWHAERVPGERELKGEENRAVARLT